MVIGALSAIAGAVVEVLARQGCSLFLVARDGEKLDGFARVLRTSASGRIETMSADITDRALHARIWDESRRSLESVDTVLIAHGFAPTDLGPALSDDAIVTTVDVNLTATISFLRHVCSTFAEMRSGTIVVISSIAGERGKARNMVYAAAKAGLTAYLEGLRNYMYRYRVRVLTIIPGNTDTPMARGQSARGPVSSPEAVGKSIVRALERRVDVVFVPRYWGIVMRIVDFIPELIYKRINW